MNTRRASKRTGLGLVLAVALLTVSLWSTGASAQADGLLDPANTAWDGLTGTQVQLELQNWTEPGLSYVGEVTEVELKYVFEGDRIFFRLVWADTSMDESFRPGEFSDAVAIQVPDQVATALPAPTMGDEDYPVRIAYWRASWQVEGDRMAYLYPNAIDVADHYPYEVPEVEGSESLRELYHPSEANHNVIRRPESGAVQELRAIGFGTLEVAEAPSVIGTGVYMDGYWGVTLSMPIERLHRGPGEPLFVAVALWNGSEGHVGGRKMRSMWISLTPEAS